MKYFVRNTGDPTVAGPYSVEEIEAKLKAGELSAEALATEDVGESLARIEHSPVEYWMDAVQIPGLGTDLPSSLNAQQFTENGVAVCRHCGHKFTGKVVPGEAVCGACGKPQSPAVEKSASTLSGVVFLLQVPLGFLAQFISLAFLVALETAIISRAFLTVCGTKSRVEATWDGNHSGCS